MSAACKMQGAVRWRKAVEAAQADVVRQMGRLWALLMPNSISTLRPADEPGHRFEPHPPYHEPQQQQAQPTPQRPTEPSQPQAAPVPPPPWQPQQPPWQTQQRHNSSSSSGGGRQHSAEDLLAAMGSLPLGTQHSEPPHRPADRPAGWAAGPGGGGSGAGWTAGMGGSGGGAGESEGPGSPLLVHMVRGNGMSGGLTSLGVGFWHFDSAWVEMVPHDASCHDAAWAGMPAGCCHIA